MAGGGYASGKHALAISDRSGLRFPYSEMVREWNGALVHYSEFEAKQPQLDPKPVGSDPQALFNPRPQRASTPVLILLDNNPFTSIIHSGTTYVNVYSEDHQRKAGDIVRFRGAPQVTASSEFLNVPTFDNVSDLSNANGFTIALGKIDSSGNVTGATTTDPLTVPVNYFYITSTSNATSGNVEGGGQNCSAGPVTLEAL